MADNDLDQPLRGKERREPEGSRPIVAIGVISTAACVALAAGLWIALVDDPLGGQPIAVAAIQETAPAVTGSVPARPPSAGFGSPASGPDGSGRSEGSPDIRLAAAPHARLPPPLTSPTADLIEQSAFGPLPKIGTDGLRPMDAYRRESAAATLTGAPRIAIVVGGLGLSQTGTQNAIETLPEDVTLAFAPYGGSLQRWVDRARAEGHEVLLQIPLEPLNYPETDPGEHTLLVSADPQVNDSELQWSLGRMTSYAGVMNYMGGRFTAEYDALGNLLASLKGRGLYYLDDSSSPASLAKAAGMEIGAPVVTADAIVDIDRDPGEIARALTQLEAIARAEGIAVGIATGFQASVAAIAAWAPEAQARGFVLVPASAAVTQ